MSGVIEGLPPEPVSWELPTPIVFGSSSYATITLRAPTAADVLKATAIPGSGGMEITLRLIGSINAEGVPYEALLSLPAWAIDQMSTYLDMFNRMPMPLPLRRAPPIAPGG